MKTKAILTSRILHPALISTLNWLKRSRGRWPALAGAALLAGTSAHGVDLVWNANTTGDWTVAGNWTPHQVPTAADNAFITNNGTYVVTVPANATATAASLVLGAASGSQTLIIDRATLTLGNASVVNPNGLLELTTANSTLTGAGAVTVNGTLSCADGTLSGTGAATIGSGGVLAIGSGGVTLARTLNNGGSTTWAGGNLTLSTGGTFNNLAGGTLDITADGRLSGSASTPINNSGLFRQTAGTVSTVVTAPLNNSGTLQVLAATLSLDLGGTHTGTFSNAAGATLEFGGGNHVLAASSFVTGPGTVTVGGSATTLSANGTFDVTGSTLNVAAGVTTLAATCNVTGTTLSLTGGGVVNYNSAGTVAEVNVTAGTLGGTAPVTVTGPLTLGGGTVTNALVNAKGGLTINGNTTLSGSKLINPGTAIWSAGNITGANGAVISNLFGATFVNSFDGNAGTGAGALPLFVNAGLFQKTNGTAPLGATSINYQFINTGTVEVQTNTLRYATNLQTAGLTLLDGGNLTGQAQPIQLLGGSLTGIGLVTVPNTLNLVNSATVNPGLPLGELDIAGNYQQTASGVLNIELGGQVPGTTFDLVTATRNATLDGTLNVTLVNGFYPPPGATFTFLTTVLVRSGAFATFNYPSNDIGLQLNYTPTAATLQVVNVHPVIAPVADQTVNELTLLTVINSATDADTPAQTLTWSLVSPPSGMTINPASGLITWTPSQTQSPSTNIITVRVTDNGTPPTSANTNFLVVVKEVNVAPVLPLISTQIVNELTLLTVTNTATEENIHATLGYTLVDPPAGASIDANGVITWTPSQNQSPGTNVITTVVTNTDLFDTTNPHLAATNSFTVIVKEVNMAPVLPAISTQTVNELTLLTVTNTATEPDIHATTAGYLLLNPPSGASIDANGIITWLPAEAQGPTTNIITTVVTNTDLFDTVNPHLAATNSFTVIVHEVNSPPVLTMPPNQTIHAETALSVTATATDPDIPAQTLTFTLVSGPAGLNVSPGGQITWTPGDSQVGVTTVTARVTDSGSPPLSDTQSVQITVVARPLLTLTSVTSSNLTLSWTALSGAHYRLQYQAALGAAVWTNLAGDVTATGSVASRTDILTSTNRFYRVQVLP